MRGDCTGYGDDGILLPLCKRFEVAHKAIAGLGNRISRKFSPEDAYRLNIFHVIYALSGWNIVIVFSFDKLVDADADVLDAYLLEYVLVS